MMAQELAVGASISRSEAVERNTIEVAEIVVVTTDGGPTTKEASFGKPNPLAC